MIVDHDKVCAINVITIVAHFWMCHQPNGADAAVVPNHLRMAGHAQHGMDLVVVRAYGCFVGRRVEKTRDDHPPCLRIAMETAAAIVAQIAYLLSLGQQFCYHLQQLRIESGLPDSVVATLRSVVFDFDGEVLAFSRGQHLW